MAFRHPQQHEFSHARGGAGIPGSRRVSKCGNIFSTEFSSFRSTVPLNGLSQEILWVSGLNGCPASRTSTSKPFLANSRAAVAPPAPDPTTIALMVCSSIQSKCNRCLAFWLTAGYSFSKSHTHILVKSPYCAFISCAQNLTGQLGIMCCESTSVYD